jgi:hypothetical protein
MTLLEEDESSTGRVWAAEFNQVTARCVLAPFETCERFISLFFQFFGGGAR